MVELQQVVRLHVHVQLLTGLVQGRVHDLSEVHGNLHRLAAGVGQQLAGDAGGVGEGVLPDHGGQHPERERERVADGGQRFHLLEAEHVVRTLLGLEDRAVLDERRRVQGERAVQAGDQDGPLERLRRHGAFIAPVQRVRRQDRVGRSIGGIEVVLLVRVPVEQALAGQQAVGVGVLHRSDVPGLDGLFLGSDQRGDPRGVAVGLGDDRLDRTAQLVEDVGHRRDRQIRHDADLLFRNGLRELADDVGVADAFFAHALTQDGDQVPFVRQGRGVRVVDDLRPAAELAALDVLSDQRAVAELVELVAVGVDADADLDRHQVELLPVGAVERDRAEDDLLVRLGEERLRRVEGGGEADLQQLVGDFGDLLGLVRRLLGRLVAVLVDVDVHVVVDVGIAEGLGQATGEGEQGDHEDQVESTNRSFSFSS